VTGYIGDFDIIDDHRSGKIVVQLNGRLNKTGVISPRFNVQVTQIENWVNLLLPARSFGKLILVSPVVESYLFIKLIPRV
jgi:small subunit ribosomal protein S15Ae